MTSADAQRIADLEARLAQQSSDLEALIQARAADRAREQAVAAILRLLGSSPTNESAIFSAVLQAIKRVQGRGGTLWLLDGEILRHQGTVSVRIPTPLWADGERKPERDIPLVISAHMLKMVQDRRTLYIPDVLAPEAAAYTRLREHLYPTSGERSYLFVPLIVDGEVVGVLNSAWTEPDAFDAERIAVLELLASPVAIAVQNARLFRELQDRHQELEVRTRELTEALEQQTATAEILQIISQSPLDLPGVLTAVAERAARLCNSSDAGVLRIIDDRLVPVAMHGPLWSGLVDDRGLPILRGIVAGRAVLDRTTVHVHDLAAEADEFPDHQALRQRTGQRTTLATPLLLNGEPIGVFVLRRLEVQPFTERQIRLLESFANQAAIAIENARLFQELQDRNRELSGTLAQQTAMADLLRVIIASSADLEPVLATICRHGARLCRAHYMTIWRRHGEVLRKEAHVGEGGFQIDPVGAEWKIDRQQPRGDAVLDCKTIHVSDVAADTTPMWRAWRDRRQETNARAILFVPLAQLDQGIGVLVAHRSGPEPFSPQEIQLLETFADQAVIAIENARLFQELQDRNRDLSEALAQQTATAEVLQIISQSPTDVTPVFEMMVERGRELCQAEVVNLLRREGDTLVRVAKALAVGKSSSSPVGGRQQIDPHRPQTVAMRDRRTIYIPDFCADTDPQWPEYRAGIVARGFRRCQLVVPLIHEGDAIGAIVAGADRPDAFSPSQIRLFETFARQAVIAIENARLFEQLQARTAELTRTVEELRALGIVGQAVNSSLDLQTVLATVCRHAVELSGADVGAIWTYDPTTDTLNIQGIHGYYPDTLADVQSRIGGGARTVDDFPILAEAIHRAEPVQIEDSGNLGDAEDPERALLRRLGLRVSLVVPLLRDGAVQGALVVRRKTPERFAEATLDLLRVFADQSALAIQNARLYQEIEGQRSQLEEISRHKSEFLASMSHELRTPLNAIIGFSEVLLDPSMPVDDAIRNQFTENIHGSGKHLLGLINDILDLSKVEAGKMELHAETFELNETLQGVHAVIRAMTDRKRQILRLDAPAEAVFIEHDPSRFKQVLYNLLSNAVKFTPDGGVITTTVRLVGGLGPFLEITITDTGIGIAPHDHEKIFEEFRQIDSGHARKQQGTGLGLALVRRIVRLMGGDVTLQSELGVGSTFTVRLPRRHGEVMPDAVGGGATVLVIEDDPAAAELLRFHLTRGGYRVERATTLEEGLALARSRPAAITLDLRLPDERDGWALLRRLKADPATTAIPIIVISILDDDRLSRQAGAVAHLVKPVDAATLLTTLNYLITHEEGRDGG